MHSQNVALCCHDGLIIISKESFRSLLNIFITYDIADLQLELASKNKGMFWYYDLHAMQVFFGETLLRDDILREDRWRILDKYREGYGFENENPVPPASCVSNGFAVSLLYPELYVVWSNGSYEQTMRDVIFAGRYPLSTDKKITHDGIEEGKVLYTHFFTECDVERLRDTVYTKDRTGKYMNSTKPLLT